MNREIVLVDPTVNTSSPKAPPVVTIPTYEELMELRAEGFQVGYRGVYIYLRYREILRALREVSFTSVLNFGCGFAIFDRLLPMGVSVVGVDAEGPCIDFANDWAKKEGRSSVYVTSLDQAVPLVGRGVDLLLASEVLEHIPQDQLPTLCERLLRFVTPGGHLLISVPNGDRIRNTTRRWLGLSPKVMDVTHVCEYSLSEAHALIRRCFPTCEVVNFRAGVLYLPLENYLSRVISPQGPLRERVLARFPQWGSHFIFLLRSPI